MIKILLVGDHPEGPTGNAHMMHGIASQIDPEKFQVAILAINPRLAITSERTFEHSKWPILDVHSVTNPCAWEHSLIGLVAGKQPIDIVLFVGLDIWMFAFTLSSLVEIKKKRKIIIASLFPYEFYSVKKEWLDWLAMIDIPLVYSEFGFNKLKPFVNKVQYFRPPLFDAKQFLPFSKEKRFEARKKLFKSINDENFVFGFFGNNQYRKDPQRVIRSFFQTKQICPNNKLYLHTEVTTGPFNIPRYLKDCGNQLGDVFIKKQKYQYDTTAMVEMYNAVDCLVSASWQEGLSWTILEAMLCGTPVVAANNTAHIELLKGGAGLPVKCDELAYLPIDMGENCTYIETYACNPDSLTKAMLKVMKPKVREGLIKRGFERAREWLAGVGDINDVFIKAIESSQTNISEKTKKEIGIKTERKKEVLFAQYSSAGDVLMTTRALKGIKEMFKGLPLTYMTSPQYMDILIHNPHIDKIRSWNEKAFNEYEFVLNPHGDRIGPGHWGRNSNSLLSDFYWKILMVQPCDFFIEKVMPPQNISLSITTARKPILILHTTGGDAEFRTYKYMVDIAEATKEKYFTVQVGAATDYPAGSQLDLRGALSFRESAWVVSKAELAVTVDSFISHLCGALGVSQVCLFGCGNCNVVRPNQMNGILTCMVIDYVNDCLGLGPCSASVRNCPLPCTGRHNPKSVLKEIEEIEKDLAKQKRME